MISGIFHQGSGLGNQLFRYIATRVLALDKGYDFSMIASENFKGKDFMNLSMVNRLGVADLVHDIYSTQYPEGKIIPLGFDMKPTKVWEENTNYFNPEFFFIEDNTIIDGEFQSEQYFGHRLKEIDEWLKIEPMSSPEDMCVIGFRGGEFYMFPELGLPKEYFDEGIRIMKEINPNMRFEVQTDDPKLARQFFPDYPIVQDIAHNWRSVRSAKYAIIANSSFYILPRLLKHHENKDSLTLSPRYWARRNTKEWSRPDNFYRAFQYI